MEECRPELIVFPQAVAWCMRAWIGLEVATHQESHPDVQNVGALWGWFSTVLAVVGASGRRGVLFRAPWR